jgi:hypothetical protein
VSTAYLVICYELPLSNIALGPPKSPPVATDVRVQDAFISDIPGEEWEADAKKQFATICTQSAGGGTYQNAYDLLVDRIETDQSLRWLQQWFVADIERRKLA